MAKKKLQLSEWKAELKEMVRKEMSMEMDEITDVDEEIMADYWREGYSPREFFKEHVLSAVDAPADDFDMRYDL